MDKTKLQIGFFFFVFVARVFNQRIVNVTIREKKKIKSVAFGYSCVTCFGNRTVIF